MAMRGRGVGIGGYRLPPPQPPMRTVSQTFRPKSDWRDEPDAAVLILYLPGFVRRQIQIRRYPETESIQVIAVRVLSNNRLIHVNETFNVPTNCDLEKLETNFDRGILMLKMPMKKDEPSSPISNLNPNHTSSLSLPPIPTPIPKHPTQTQTPTPTPTATPNLNSNATTSHSPAPAPTSIAEPNLDAKHPIPTTPMTSTPTATPNPNSNLTASNTPTPTPPPTTAPTHTPTFAPQGRKENEVLAVENDGPSIQPCQQDHKDHISQEKDVSKKTDDKTMRDAKMKENGQKELELTLSPREKRQLLVNMGVAALLILGFIASTYNSLP